MKYIYIGCLLVLFQAGYAMNVPGQHQQKDRSVPALCDELLFGRQIDSERISKQSENRVDALEQADYFIKSIDAVKMAHDKVCQYIKHDRADLPAWLNDDKCWLHETIQAFSNQIAKLVQAPEDAVPTVLQAFEAFKETKNKEFDQIKKGYIALFVLLGDEICNQEVSDCETKNSFGCNRRRLL